MADPNDKARELLDRLAAEAADRIFGAGPSGKFDRGDFMAKVRDAFGGDPRDLFDAGGFVAGEKTACPPRGESVFRSWGPAGYARAQGWDLGADDRTVIFEVPPCQAFADRGEAVWPTSEALRAGLKDGGFQFSKPGDSAGSYRRDDGRGWRTPEGDYVLHGNRARSARTGREYERPQDDADTFGTQAYWRKRFREDGSPYTGRRYGPDVTSFRDPPKVFFLSKGYLAVSERPGVAVAAAQLRAALAAGATGVLVESKLMRLKLRVARELRQDIADLEGACTS